MLTFFASLATLALAAPAGDLIKALPGAPHVNFKQYAGYVDVTAQRSLFYWFVEHEKTPKTAPLIVWLNGGPGCSSMLGMFTENGPWRVDRNQKLRYDDQSWNKQANMLYIDSPAGVGFSYNEQPNYSSGDNQTMTDLYTFLNMWFTSKFPEYVGNDLYIAGESYGGHYVPQLTWTIIKNNNKGVQPILNLKGMLVGNPWTDDNLDGNAVPAFIYSHALCSLDTWQLVEQKCGDFLLPDVTAGAYDHMKSSDFLLSMRTARVGSSCDGALDKMYNEIGDRINQYDIYVNCEKSIGGLDCMNYGAVDTYLRNPGVLAAIHVRVSKVQNWQVCTSVNYVESWPSVVPIYPTIIAALGKVMVYSGDVTFNCGFIGSQRWIQSLNMTVASPWQQFLVHNQTAGYRTAYKGGLEFVTIRDAGHMTPQYQPERSFEMLRNYLSGKWN